MKKLGEENSHLNIDMSQAAENAAEFLKTLANPNRLIILGCLLKGESNVGELEKSLNISQSALSQHLSRMRGEGILARRRESQQIFYSICDDRVEKFLSIANELFYNNQEK
ncbi:ArsR/SmtB family transcription factor [Pseudemcibacter aquimaris]|uniref:ArsR/SmtB family transcription factor n=1 Tax=Pseudemcibacter aquimaris TaxID=2857064 RepID=UPI002011492A|nr:metalloregulator ArsR/SmtB family transcription factor [Pseudemcibacter aquimaris]MCC3860290.1 metalloregulator ArsR/SmtB family transcription factor [Pseudemcibacter aquimaris]WDU57615.1 metalloregulator ArsR/SmtB family transcription factor [Pseudemcibacter aquimaris]